MIEILIVGILLGLIPASIARGKGRDFVPWWIYGALLFIVALPHSLLLKPDSEGVEIGQRGLGKKKCPECAEYVQSEAKKCRFCGHILAEAARVTTKPRRMSSLDRYKE